MSRLALGLAAWMCLVSVAPASLTPRKGPAPFPSRVSEVRSSALAVPAYQQATARETNSEFILTDRTEVLLNGKPCRYADIPGDARIVVLEVAADRKTVLKIHFRTGK